jgi:hypothetical protein
MQHAKLVWLSFVYCVTSMLNGCNSDTSRDFSFPSAGDVESVSVALAGEFLNEPNTDEFALGRQHFKNLLECLSSRPVRSGNERGFGASIIRLELKTEKQLIKVEIPWSGKNRLYFTVDGVPYEREGDYEMINPITKAEMGFPPDESLLLYRYLQNCYDGTKAGSSSTVSASADGTTNNAMQRSGGGDVSGNGDSTSAAR